MAQATNKRTTSSLNPQARCCSRWGLHWPDMSPYLRWALTSPFHPYLNRRLFSVALSLRFPSLDVIQHHCSMEPGLSSYAAFRPCYTRLSNLLLFYFNIFLKNVNYSIINSSIKFLYFINSKSLSCVSTAFLNSWSNT